MNFSILVFALLGLPGGPDRSNQPVMLDFTAAWCGPCRSMKPAVDQLVKQGYPIRPVDIDASPELAERYNVTGVPCFVVVDPADGKELARTSGAQPAENLVSLYREAKAKLRPAARVAQDDPDEDEAAADTERPVPRRADPAPDAGAPNPRPWETVVRIKVHGNGYLGFGSGTVIYSSPRESIVLTCAHIFKMDGRKQALPSQFPLKITVDLFDGKLTGQRPAQVHYANETYEGEAIDYNFNLDVGLIRIRPGRRLPFARVVPPHWSPKEGMSDLITVGCSEGHDATAWSTRIVNPAMKGLNGNGSYEAIVCTNAPKQGRSGGGLFTSDGYIAGVCDFAEPTGNHGLYAAPASIYKMLDRNRLTALYSPGQTPGDSGRLLANASGSPRPAPRRVSAEGEGDALVMDDQTQVRGQSPDREEATPGQILVPPPHMLNIKPPVLAATGQGAGKVRRQSWHASPSMTVPSTDTELRLDPSLDPDHFDDGKAPTREPEVGASRGPSRSLPLNPPDAESSSRKVPVGRAGAQSKWRAGRAPLPALEAAPGR